MGSSQNWSLCVFFSFFIPSFMEQAETGQRPSTCAACFHFQHKFVFGQFLALILADQSESTVQKQLVARQRSAPGLGGWRWGREAGTRGGGGRGVEQMKHSPRGFTLPSAGRTGGQSWRLWMPFPAKPPDSHSGSNYYFCIWGRMRLCYARKQHRGENVIREVKRGSTWPHKQEK